MSMPKDITQQFISEVLPQLAIVRQELERFAETADRQLLTNARRVTHRMKGEASVVGFAGFSHVAFLQEELLDEAVSTEASETHLSAVVEVLESLEAFASAATEADAVNLLRPAIVAYRRFRDLPEAEDEAEIRKLLSGDDSDEQPEEVTRSQSSGLDQSLLASYRHEVSDHMQVVLDHLQEDGELHAEELQDVRRAVHSIKGGASAIGLQEAADLAHAIEDLVEQAAEADIELLEDLKPLLIRAIDVLGGARR